MTNRKFHRYVYKYEVLSEDPMDYVPTLNDLQHLTYDGPCSGRMLEPEHEVLDGKQAAECLMEQASAPDFFNLTVNGEDFEDGADEDVMFPVDRCNLCGCDLKDGKCPEGHVQLD